MIAWASDPEALGPPPPGVEIVGEADPEVEFVVPRWTESHALRELPALRVVQVLLWSRERFFNHPIPLLC